MHPAGRCGERGWTLIRPAIPGIDASTTWPGQEGRGNITEVTPRGGAGSGSTTASSVSFLAEKADAGRPSQCLALREPRTLPTNGAHGSSKSEKKQAKCSRSNTWSCNKSFRRASDCQAVFPCLRGWLMAMILVAFRTTFWLWRISKNAADVV